MPFRLPRDYPPLETARGLFVLRWAHSPGIATLDDAELLVTLVSYVGPDRREFPAGTAAVRLPRSVTDLSLDPPNIDRRIWGPKADLEIFMTLLSWAFFNGAEAVTAGGVIRFEEDWVFEREALLTELNRPIWEVKKGPVIAAHMDGMSTLTPLRTTSEAFPTSITVARELSRAIQGFRKENQSWREISERLGITRIEALRLGHDLDGVLESIRSAA